nr:hypothetical protein [Thiocystis violacea]
MTISAFGPADLLRIARLRARGYQEWEQRAGSLAVSRPSSPDARLRIGYLSDDFQEHATAYLTASLFERHDRGQFEIFAYSTGPDDGGPMRRRLAAAFDHFVDIRSMPHLAAAQRMRDDGIDILVDLKGYTKNARLEILALRPSPIQVSWLGFPGGLGAAFIDYLIADPVVIPPEHAVHYDESIAYLPGTYAPVDDARVVAETPARAAVGLPEDGFVFCCFNDPYKITPDIFDRWCRVLRDTPNGILWLYARTDAAQNNLRREAQARGVAPERLIFAPKLPQAEHLARLAQADLFLDTRPVNAHTTASDALWMGVPVLTCPGDTFASRVAASLVTAVGVPELIAADLDHYETLARELAKRGDALAAIKMQLRKARQESIFFDSQQFVGHLEDVYRRMWGRHTKGEAPVQLGPAGEAGPHAAR